MAPSCGVSPWVCEGPEEGMVGEGLSKVTSLGGKDMKKKDNQGDV